jgi:hypothetical protein
MEFDIRTYRHVRELDRASHGTNVLPKQLGVGSYKEQPKELSATFTVNFTDTNPWRTSD